MASHEIPVTTSSDNGHSSENAASPLEGACSCGRNQYTIHLASLDSQPPPAVLVIDTSLTSRQTHSTPLPTFLRVPLRSLHSTTTAFYPGEHHTEIRRVFTPAHAPRTKRHFCGFCGTQLSFWQEDSENRDIEEWICVNVGTLGEDDVERLEDSGVLRHDGHDLVTSVRSADAPLSQVRTGNEQISGQPWFEELIRDTKIGRIRQARGGQTSNDGRSRFEWQVVEFDGEQVGADLDEEDVDMGVAESITSPPKRKVADMAD